MFKNFVSAELRTAAFCVKTNIISRARPMKCSGPLESTMPDFAFSRRTNWELTANRLNDEMERLRSKKADIIDLTESNPTRCGFEYPKEILNALSDPANLMYAPDSKGMLKARREIARHIGSVDPEAIVFTSSTSEAYAFLLRLLVNPGERVLIAKPSYPLFQYLI